MSLQANQKPQRVCDLCYGAHPSPSAEFYDDDGDDD